MIYNDKQQTPTVAFVTEHHRNEVRKHFDWLVNKYASADYRNTNTEAGCIWNDAVNLANGIRAQHSSGTENTAPALDAASGVRAATAGSAPVAVSSEVAPAHLQDAPRTLRSTFKVQDPNDPKKTVAVVYASVAVCLEREANSLRAHLSATAEITRLREIEHAAWHAMEASAEDADGCFVPMAEALALSKLLPDDHPGNEDTAPYVEVPARK